MKINFGKRQVEMDGKYLAAQLRDCSDILDDIEALRSQLDADGYLLIRGLHDRDVVLNARRAILEYMASFGCIDESADLMDAVMKPAVKAPRTSGQ